MSNTATKKLNPRKTFWKCGACSHAMFHLINDAFDNVKLPEEKASDILAGGMALKGHQCGMLWGGSLAIGTEAYKRYEDEDETIAKNIYASALLMQSFYRRKHAVNCREISKVDWNNKFQLATYMLKIVAQGFVYSPCFNLIVRWTPEAVEAVKKGFSETIRYNKPCFSCASEVVKKMGGTYEECIMVAGFAGGIGLSGHGCGALAAAIWYKMLQWGRNNNGKNPSMFKNQDVQIVLNAFNQQTNSEMVCSKICNRTFKSVDTHSDYVVNGGCSNIIETLARC